MLGRSARVRYRVGPADTAAALGSGDVSVLGTPKVLALLEQATVAAIAGDLSPAQTSVGAEVTLRHRAPTPVDAEVTAVAEVTSVQGPRVTFDVRLEQDDAVVATGTVVRVLVDRAGFGGVQTPVVDRG